MYLTYENLHSKRRRTSLGLVGRSFVLYITHPNYRSKILNLSISNALGTHFAGGTNSTHSFLPMCSESVYMGIGGVIGLQRKNGNQNVVGWL
jgi:gamma-glutamyl phosphate reductase